MWQVSEKHWNKRRNSRPECSVKKLYLKFSENSQENTFAGVSF